MSKDDSGLDPARRIAELEAENARLRRINQALIERVESGQAQRAGPYAAFEHSVVLAEQVRDRTEALNHALSELKVSHRALKRANQQAATAHQRLIDAIESISDAFVLFDSERRILLFNSKFEAVWQGSGVEIATGITIADIKRLAQQSGLVAEQYPGAGDTRVFRLANGNWVQMRERPTSDGGLVILYTDITDLKARETLRREQALAQKSRLLQRTVENLSQGVVLVNPDGRLEVWNERFVDLTGVDRQLLERHPPFEALLSDAPDALLTPDSGNSLASERHLGSGRVIEVRTHPMPDGGFVNTYTDITERHQHAEALRESERWIRLITDHVPALIAYVDDQLRFSFTNQVYDDWYGWPRGALNGRTIRQVHGEAQFEKLRPYMARALAGESVTFEIAERNGQGEERYMLKSYVPNRQGDGRPVGFFVLIRDITERRRTAEELKQAYQHMEQRVHERTSELMALNKQLLLEIDERRQAEARLREAKKEAEQANLSKTKFLAAVSHDLLQPLNAARLFTGALAEQPLDAQPRSLVGSLSNSLEDVESLLSTLVDISKLDAGVVQPDLTCFQVRELLDNIANEYRQVAQSEGLQLRFVGSSAVIRSDSQLLARILRNFLSNAIRYTRHGRILLGCRRRGDRLRLEVWDTGVGIPQAQLREIFQEFKRLQPAEARQDKGLGLGLAIVDKISRVLDHPISVASQQGRGSMFAVEVPLGTLPAPSATQGPALPHRAERLQGARIWVIDNDQAICEGMATLMRGWGCQVCTALSLEDLLRQRNPARDPVDLIIADYHLDNGRTGVEAVDAITELMAAPVPVLMITANYSQELKAQIRRKGHLLINKPVRPLKLKTTLNHLLEQ
ncbi:hybrid sensor histidine kinase/response regulator [Marinobacterium arenosum]|uniref:hybrid sensor histidine kinase/response regulator n=1 Tax=Marinobacterium arenosum TaxID=2862496 RepID=UPI001C979AE6|nr:NahK/ErcS family hybrid sensor histidine kinase/response regulator [Marinobacterium arenosum]MBY4675872.1 PAS-domain containing protein [Marinobacterium arenosum]